MQLIIDTHNDTPRALAAVARLLQDLAGVKSGCAKAPDTSATEAAPKTEVGKLELRVDVDTTEAQQKVADLAAAADQLPEQLRAQMSAHVAPVEQDDAYAVFTAGETTPAPAAATPAPDMMPLAQTSSAPTSPGSVELDSAGLPWDARIHASTRTKLKGDGTWKLKRGIHDHEVERVTTELRAIMGAGRGESAFHADTGSTEMDAALRADQAKLEALGAVAPTGLFPPHPIEARAAQVAIEQLAAQPAPQLTPPAADTTARPLDFAGLMQMVTAAQTAGKLTPTAIMDAVRSVGLNALPDLIHRPDLVPAVGDKIQELTGGA